MQRRTFIIALTSAAAWPWALRAQKPGKVARIGLVTTASLDARETLSSLEAFRQGMRELGYVEGETFTMEIRSADSEVSRFRALTKELVGLKVDIIVALNSLSGRAAREATNTIPIVVPVMGDPVEDGLVASLARPGGNVTGFTFLGPQLVPKRLALLKEALPSASQVAVLWHPSAYSSRTMNNMVDETRTAAAALGFNLRFIPVPDPGELDRAFSTIGAAHVDAVMVFPSPMLFNARTQIVALGRMLRLPMISMAREFVVLGGLMSYGADINEFIRRGAVYVDRILKGARPMDLPVEQPTRFGLSINLKTAKELGIELPATLLARADEVIE